MFHDMFLGELQFIVVSVECCNAVTLILQRYSVTAFNGQNPALQRSTSTDSVTALNGQNVVHYVVLRSASYSVTALCYSVTALNEHRQRYSAQRANHSATALQRYSATALNTAPGPPCHGASVSSLTANSVSGCPPRSGAVRRRRCSAPCAANPWTGL